MIQKHDFFFNKILYKQTSKPLNTKTTQQLYNKATQINQKLYCLPNKIAISPPTNPKSRTNEIPIYKKFMNLLKQNTKDNMILWNKLRQKKCC